MFSFFKREKTPNEEINEDVITKLKKLYKAKLLPFEEKFEFHNFHLPKLEDADFEGKPLIMLIGQYSTGKTTFIRHMLKCDFPGLRIGPEPTTDRFIVIMHDEKEGVVPGNALVLDRTKQFYPLRKYGNSFLNRFQCSFVKSQVLQSISIIDTPGILSGQKQTVDRGYDFVGVLEWYAERADRILLMFDAHKLDISDELYRTIQALQGHDNKIRIILNKADLICPKQLLRVYGALMWSLSKVLHTPEVIRVYVGSFWDQPLKYEENRRLFESDEHDLLNDIRSIPRYAILRKFNDLVKRARTAKVHALIINELHKDMPVMFGKERKKRDLIKNLDQVYKRIQREHNVPSGDFPDLKNMRKILEECDFSSFHSLKSNVVDSVNSMLDEDISRLMQMIPSVDETPNHESTVNGGVFENTFDSDFSPFGFLRNQGVFCGFGDHEWICLKEKPRTDGIFNSLGPINGKISGSKAKQELMKSKLPNSVLSKIWKLSDVDGDGFLDSDEFALALHLIRIKIEGNELPITLPDHLVPPSKRCLR